MRVSSLHQFFIFLFLDYDSHIMIAFNFVKIGTSFMKDLVKALFREFETLKRILDL